jgi:Clostripain family
MSDKEWTIMVYMAGDNNLSESMAKAIQEAKKNTLPNDKVSLLVYFDSAVRLFQPKFYDILNNEAIDVRDSSTFRVLQPIAPLEPNMQENSSSKNSIINFVKWCVEEKNHKAKNYALFLSGHSNAFDEVTLLRDNSSKEVLSIPELKDTLVEVNKIINENKEGQRTLDIIGFDSCVMNLIEIAYQFNGLAKYMIASQGETPIAGFDYGQILKKTLLVPNRSRTAESLVGQIVVDFMDQQKDYLEGGRSADLSALKLENTNSVIKSIEELFNLLAKLLTKNIDDYFSPELLAPFSQEQSETIKILIQQQINKSILSAHWNCQTHWFDQAVDISDFCQKLFDDIDFLNFLLSQFDSPHLKVFNVITEDIRKDCQNVIDNVGQYVIASGSCGADFQFARGVSLFFPWSIKAYRELAMPYSKLDFARNAGKSWVTFLENYLFDSLKRVKKINPGKNTPSDTTASPSSEESDTDTRGTKTDKLRGVRTDKPRGADFIEAFRVFKNYDSDYWDYFESLDRNIITRNRKGLQFSTNLKDLNLNMVNSSSGKIIE